MVVGCWLSELFAGACKLTLFHSYNSVIHPSFKYWPELDGTGAPLYNYSPFVHVKELAFFKLFFHKWQLQCCGGWCFFPTFSYGIFYTIWWVSVAVTLWETDHTFLAVNQTQFWFNAVCLVFKYLNRPLVNVSHSENKNKHFILFFYFLLPSLTTSMTHYVDHHKHRRLFLAEL